MASPTEAAKPRHTHTHTFATRGGALMRQLVCTVRCLPLNSFAEWIYIWLLIYISLFYSLPFVSSRVLTRWTSKMKLREPQQQQKEIQLHSELQMNAIKYSNSTQITFTLDLERARATAANFVRTQAFDIRHLKLHVRQMEEINQPIADFRCECGFAGGFLCRIASADIFMFVNIVLRRHCMFGRTLGAPIIRTSESGKNCSCPARQNIVRLRINGKKWQYFSFQNTLPIQIWSVNRHETMTHL